MNVVRSEWTKLRSVRGTWTLVVVALLASVAVGLLGVTSQLGGWQSALPHDFDPTVESLKGLLVGQLLVGTLGASVMASEYGHGTIVTTLAVVPDRTRLIAAKALLTAAIAAVAAVAITASCFLLGQAAIAAAGLPGASLTDPAVLRALGGAVVYLTAVALLGLAIATLTRSASTALGVLVTLALLGPALTPALPGAVGDAIAEFWPLAAGQAGYAVVRTAEHVAPGVGVAVLVAFTAVIGAVATAAMRWRDA